MHNTHNGELPGHHNYGDGVRPDPAPGANPHKEAELKAQGDEAGAAKAAAENKAVEKEASEKKAKAADEAANKPAADKKPADAAKPVEAAKPAAEAKPEADAKPSAEAKLQLTDERDGYDWDRASNEYDTEAVSVMSEINNKSYYVDHGKSVVKPHKRRIIDADGDGVEDNVDHTHHELDKFNKPRVFGVAVEDMHNTHNGELPGHHRFGEGHEPGTDPWAEARAKEAEAAKAKSAEKEKAAASTDV